MTHQSKINVAVCGHVSHGKSTLIGRIIVDLGLVDKARLNEPIPMVEQPMSKDYINKYSALMYLMAEERTTGRSVFPSHVRIPLAEAKLVTIVDTPGHSRYSRARAYGLFMADCAILVVSLNEGIKPQTMESLYFMKALDIPLVGVVLSKSDLAPEKDHAIRLLKVELMTTLDSIGMRAPIGGIEFFAVSALHDESIEPLTRFITTLTLERPVQAAGPLRFCVQGRQELFTIDGVGSVAKGIVESGELRVNDRLLVQPASHNSKVDIIFEVRRMELARGRNEPRDVRHHQEFAGPRDIVSVNFRHLTFDDMVMHLEKGAILSHVDQPPRIAELIEAEIFITCKPSGAFVGWDPYLLLHVMGTQCRLVEILTITDEMNHNVSLGHGLILQGWTATVKLQLEKALPIEQADAMPRLSRFTLREKNIVAGFGYCRKVLE